MWTFKTKCYQFIWYVVPETGNTFTSNLSVYRNHIKIYNDVQTGCSFSLPRLKESSSTVDNSPSFYDMVRTAIKTIKGAMNHGAISSDRENSEQHCSRFTT